MHLLGSTLHFGTKSQVVSLLLFGFSKTSSGPLLTILFSRFSLTNACTIATSPTDSSPFVIKFNCILPTEKPLSRPTPLHALQLKKTLGYHMNYCSAYFCSHHAFQKHHCDWSFKLYVLQEMCVNLVEVDDVTAFDLQILLPLAAVFNLKTSNILSLANFVRELFAVLCFYSSSWEEASVLYMFNWKLLIPHCLRRDSGNETGHYNKAAASPSFPAFSPPSLSLSLSRVRWGQRQNS